MICEFVKSALCISIEKETADTKCGIIILYEKLYKTFIFHNDIHVDTYDLRMCAGH